MCQVEEASALPCPQMFTAYRGLGQILTTSGDPAQLQPYLRDHTRRLFQGYLAVSTTDMLRGAVYPIIQLSVQHRAVDGQFDIVYELFYPEYKAIKSADSWHPSNHPDAQRVEDDFVADFDDLEALPAGKILPVFIHVPGSTCQLVGKSRHSPEQTKAAVYAVQNYMKCDAKPEDIMVVGRLSSGEHRAAQGNPQTRFGHNSRFGPRPRA